MVSFHPPYIIVITFCLLVLIAGGSFSEIVRCAIKETNENLVASTCVLITSLVGIFSMLFLM